MKKKIFVVDDDPAIRTSVKQALEYYNPTEYDVMCVEDGRKCLELLRAKQIPDLIVLDIMMPELSGWDTFEQLKENQLWKNIPVVFLTARADQIAKDAGGFFGDDYIEKPFDIHDLEKRINKILKKNNSKSR